MTISILGEGNTSLKHIEDIYFKCEFENPTGSHKDRAMAVQLEHAKRLGRTSAVISSSGNAAISAAFYARHFGIDLTVFVGQHINTQKLTILEQGGIVHQVEQPLKESLLFAKKTGAYNLRQSTDSVATHGYEAISHELYQKLADIDAIFIPSSSATSAQGIYDGYIRIGTIPALHIVQTERIHPIASIFDKKFEKKDYSLADAIVAKTTARGSYVIEAIRKSHGSGWVISDTNIQIAHQWLIDHNIETSYEGAAALSAVWKAEKNGFVYKNPVVILTGKYYGL